MLRRRATSVSAAAWMAAPMATTSSGFTRSSGGAPKNCSTRRRTSGMRVEPPTRMTLSKPAHGQARDRQRLLAHGEGALDERRREHLELVARHPEVEVEVRAADAERDLAQLGVRAVARRQLDLDRLGRHAQALERLRVGPRVVAVRVQEGLGHALGDGHVEVVAAEERVARGREHLEHVAGQVEQRAVERAAAEVVDGDALLRGASQAVRERRRRRLVDDAQDVEPGDAARRPSSPRAAAR